MHALCQRANKFPRYDATQPPRLRKPHCIGNSSAMKAMTDGNTTVAELRARVLAFVRERDWEQFHSPKNLSMALAAESGELMEHFLWAESKASLDVARDPKKRRAIEDEVADVVIYALEFANICGIDLAAAIETKMSANAKKYPVEKAKGRADKYTEL
jgi:dCTP diphosphatase